MDKVRIKDIAEELGINSKEVLHKAVLMAIDVKSIRSSISIENAQKIFDAIIYNQNIGPFAESARDTLFFTSKNLNLYLCESSVDVNFLNNISLPYENDAIDNFLLLSYNYSDKVLQELYLLSLNKLNIEQYLKDKFTANDLEDMEKNIKNFCNEFDVSSIDGDKPLDKIKYYSSKYKPQLIIIEGINIQDLEKNNFEVLSTIKKLSLFNIKFELGVINVNLTVKDKFKKQLIDTF